MFSPKYWVYCERMSVKQFCEYLQNNVPEDAELCVCGESRIYMHMESDGSVFSVDDCSLSDMEEYEGYEARRLEVE